MTRQRPSPGAPQRASTKRALLRPLRPVRNLTDEVIARLKKEIGSGRLAPGARLPTEQELMEALGVSRTVVREAVAALRADGLITTRQGSGAYVAADVSRVPFRIDPEGLSSIEDVLEVMELRLAIEVEAAARAAQRITPRTLAAVGRVLTAIDAAVERGEGAVNEDFAFHLAIAEASGNSRFAEMLEFLGRHVIPRQSVRLAMSPPEEQRKYLARIQSEHRRIHEALRRGDPGEARKAMREHLTRSLKRYRGLAERQMRPS
jgi:DNA-binding FadR family transcriptional regulator